MLKADFHSHTSEDVYDKHHIRYTPRQLIDRAAKFKFDLFSITHHNHIYFPRELRGYAKHKGMHLMPGTEAKIEGGHVVIINATDDDLRKLHKVSDLAKIQDHALIIAAHPFYPFGNCLKEKVVNNINCFDAIEYCHFYAGFMQKQPLKSIIQGNETAVRVAEKYKKPLVATSDAHRLYEVGPSYTLVDCKKTTESFVDAVKRSRVKFVSSPMDTGIFLRRAASLLAKEIILRRLQKVAHMPDIADEPYLKRGTKRI